VSRATLLRADREARAAGDREHVLTWARRHARVVPVTQATDLAALRWTLDTEADYAIIAAIYDALYPRHPSFRSRDVYELLVRRPELIRVDGTERLSPGERREWVTKIEAHLALEAR